MKQRIYYRIMKVTQTFPVILWLFFSSFLFATYTHAQTIKGEQSTEGITIFKLPTDPDQMWELTKEGTDSGIRSNGNYPPIWEHPVNTGTIHNYIVNLAANPRVNNIPLQPGDWMGGFYLDDNNVLRCGGSRMWTGTENVMITLFGDDNMTPEKDGFDFGELIEFRFFLQQTQKEYVVSIASYHVQLGYVTNGRWYPLSLSMFMDMKAVCAFDFYIQASENPTCIGNQVTLSAEEFVGTGGPYTYSWSSIPEGFNYNIKNPPPITLNVTTDFFLTVTAPNNISNHQITLLVHDFPTANAGSDGTICENEIFNVSGTSTNAFSVLWETNGDGSFTNPTKASTNYTPGPIDKVNGTVELTFNAEPFSPCQTGASDNLTLTIQSLPTVDAGPDMNGCETLPLTIEATSTNYSSVQWTTSGTGTFSDPNSLITQYTPSSNDITNDVTLTVSVQSISPCQTTTSDNMKITFIPPPTCSAPTTIRRCEGTAFNLNGSVTNSSGILWTTQGDGTFANPEQLQTIYYPGPQDIENSGTQVTLTAYALPPCTMPATKAVSIIIQQLPRILTFGENTDFACNEIPLQLNAEVTQYNTISWSRTGDGTFNKTNILNPIYTPGPNDKTNGFFTLTLSATSKVPCLTGTTLSKTIYIVNNPTVEINTPSNQLFCAELQLQATANSYDSLLWITNGDGNFSNSTVLNPTYYAGENDMDTGANIKLTLVAAPIAPCLVAAESYIYASFKRPPSANAGNNATICENQTHTLNGIAQSYSTVQWETNGSGTFNNPSILNPVYTPSDADKTAGSVVLTLTAQPISPCADSASDQMILTIKRLAVANAGSDATICEDATYTLNGTAQRYSSVSWGSSGTGTFSNPSILKPVYTPSLADITTGSVVLTLTAQPISPCTVSTSDQMTLTIQRLAEVNAGYDATICEDATYTLDGTAQRYSSVSWSSSGTGTFNNPSILKPVYTPSAADKIAGSVVLTLTAQPISPCVVSTSDQMILTIQRLAFANAGSDATICEDATYTLNGTAQRYSSVSWNSSGTGTFNKPSILKPVYTPSLADITAGSVVLTLTAQPISPCTVSTSDQMTLTIQRLATANAGDNVTICENETVTLNGTAQRYSSVSWSSSGTGTFNNPSILKPIYTPSAADKISGSVVLTLTAQPISPCSVTASDQMTLTIQRLATANAGSNATICEDATYTLNGTAQRYSSVSWSSSGTGTFSNPSILKPVYTPSLADITAGSVVLTLTAQPISPCSVSASDQMILTIQRNAIANAGSDATICEDATYTMKSTAQRYSSVSWSSSGTGTFNNPSILKPVYTPSAADKIAGSVVLTLTAQPISPCIVSASDQMTLTIQRLATANAGDNVTICENETVTLNGTAQRYSSVSWSSSGTGTFNNPSILKPVYTPSEQDKNTGLVIITLTVQPISPCAVAATDYVIINIYRMPVVSAGNDAAICEDEAITLNGTAQRYSSLSWSTSGTGTFNNPSILKPVYTPSAADKTNGSVALTLTVQPISPCSITVSDQMTLFIENLNIIHNLEPTQTVNMGSTLNLVFEVEAHNDGIYTWFFNDEAIENSNNSIFTIPSISATDAGYYLCLFVHNCGEVSSNESFVQVIQLSAHEINLPQLWSGISSYVVPDNPAMNAIFAQIINNIEIVQNYDGIYWPSQNINTLGNWSTTKGYRIKMLNTDQLMISGTVQYPVDELTLPPNWSIIPVNVPCIINTSEFFSDYPSILMIKEIAGSQIYWPEYNINSLVELLPGKAYEIYNSSSQPINITFPLCDGPLMNFEFKSVEPDIIHPWNPIYKTPISHIFGFLPEATGQFEQGDLIGIFTQSDLCAGIAKVEVIDKAFSLTAFGTDIFASDKTGFEYAEPVKFKIFKPTTGQEYPLNIQYSDGADESLFTANGITLIKKAECLMTNVESQSGLVKDFHVYVFPNPTTGNINITLTSNATFDGKFEIINTSGQLIQKVNFKHTNNNTTQSVDLSNNPAGIYYLRIIGENILKTRKILLR